MYFWKQTIGKSLVENDYNEDAAIATSSVIAVSDGAGGGGVFADKWSRYLLEKLPLNPMTDFIQFDEWIDSIWEPFYNQQEIIAQKNGGLFLDKFYNEGSYATICAAWIIDGNKCRWIAYGDSVVFCYNKKTRALHHSMCGINDFENRPYLVNFNRELNQEGFKTGDFHINEDSVIFCTSDAFAFFIIMNYLLFNKELYDKEISSMINSKNCYSNMFKVAMDNFLYDSFDHMIADILKKSKQTTEWIDLIRMYKDRGMLRSDDYSIAVFSFS